MIKLKLARWATLTILLSTFFMVSLVSLMAQTPQEAEVEFYIKSRSTEQSLTVGDQLTLRLEVKHPTGSRVSLPQVGREWGAFQVIEQTPPVETNNDDGTSITGKEIIVTIFQPGLYKTPNLIVTHRTPNGTIEDLASPVILLKISTVITDEDDMELRDLKDQAAMPVPLIWPWVALGLLAVSLLIFALAWAVWWFYIRKRKPVVEVEPVPVPVIQLRPPEEIALEELERIAALKLPEQEKVKEHYSLVSECIREYVENRYQIPAPEQTTVEINHTLRKRSLPIGHLSGLMGLLRESDLVKFARYQPSRENIISLVDKARHVVTVTTPKPAPSPPPDKLEKQL